MNKKKFKTYSIDQCLLYKCKSKKKLASFFNTELSTLKNVLNEKEYFSFPQKKKNSLETRLITAPSKSLKNVQKRLYILLSRINRPDWVMSGVKGKSYIDNASFHSSSNYLCKMDIKKFYDHCTRDRVYQFFFQKLKTSPDVANLLTDICTYNNSIPTGCPTSQIIAFFAYEDMFVNLENTAKYYHCNMSLYVDDMVFSSKSPFKYQNLKTAVDIEIRKFNHKLNSKKTKYYSTKKGAPVTGVIIKNGSLKIPNSLRLKIIKEFHILKRNSNTREKNFKSFNGKVNAARQIENFHFNGIKSFIKKS